MRGHTQRETGLICLCVCVCERKREISGLKMGGSTGQRRSVCCVSVGESLFSSLSSVGGFGATGREMGLWNVLFPSMHRCTPCDLCVTDVSNDVLTATSLHHLSKN
ncbi:hypothetical protein QQF64_023378 [Cirrhinus molitorella]|uniref:Secreted protein n=1 Tax=Cirrhinus molitorella TaxID=172907 RepID=A0ABR3L5A3_9TELE